MPEETSVLALPPETTPEDPTPTAHNASLGAVVDYIAGYRPQSCFAAYAREQADGSVKVSAYSADAAADAGLRDAMAGAVDGDVAMQMNQLSQSQCGVLRFARGVPGYPAPRIGGALASNHIANGGALTGTIETGGAPYTYVLVVDNDGGISEIRRFMQPGTDTLNFEQPISLSDGGRAATQLLVVVTSSVPLDTEALYGDLAAGADTYFKQLTFETVVRETMDQSVFDIAITEFVVD